MSWFPAADDSGAGGGGNGNDIASNRKKSKQNRLGVPVYFLNPNFVLVCEPLAVCRIVGLVDDVLFVCFNNTVPNLVFFL
jgi:hypothetical protein